jgi:hypothetical protein
LTADRRRFSQRHRRVQRQGHHRQPPVGQRPCRLRHRGAAVQSDGLAVGDESGHRRGDPPLAVHDLDRSHRERQLLAAHQQVHRAAPHPSRDPALDEHIQVAADRQLGRAELGSRGYDIDPAVPTQDRDQLAQTLRRIHGLQGTPDMYVRTSIMFESLRAAERDAGPAACAGEAFR